MKNGHLPTTRAGKQALLLAAVASLVMAQTACSRGAAKVDRTYAQPMLRSSEASAALRQRIAALGQGFDGDIGIAVEDVQTGPVAEFDGRTFFPQQSVSKFWVALAALDAADRGRIKLDTPVVLTPSDLTLFHQPIANEVRTAGRYRTTLGALMTRALQQSDNTCNDFILRAIGGPGSVRAFIDANNIAGVRFGPGERLMQSRIAGLTWHQQYSLGDAFFRARAEVPLARRRAAFDAYVADPVDGAQPVAVVNALARLQRGELISASSTARLLGTMSHTRTGPQRLKGGLAPGWSLAHKTGTGQEIGATQTGYNDIGILTSPGGRSYAVAVMIRRTAAPIWSRMVVMQNVVRAVIAYDSARPIRPQSGVTAALKR